MRTRFAFPVTSTCQRGAVLFVALVMLVLLTILGLSISTTSIYAEKSVAAARNQAIAFQSAEAAQTVAVAKVAAADPNLICSGAAGIARTFDDSSTGVATAFGARASWPSGGASIDLSTVAAAGNGEAARDPAYLIEAAEFVSDSSDSGGPSAAYGDPGGGSFSCGLGTATGVMYFRITARGTGAEDFSVVPATSSALQVTVARRR